MSNENQIWLKVTNEKEFHYDHQYHDGLNILNKPFDTTGSCVEGGFYFTSPEYIHEFLSYGCNIRIITLPTDDPGFIMVKDPAGDKWRANKIILNKKYSLRDIETYTFLKNIGALNDMTCDDFMRKVFGLKDHKIFSWLLSSGYTFNSKKFIKILDIDEIIFVYQQNVIDIYDIIVHTNSRDVLQHFLQLVNPDDIPLEIYKRAIYKNLKKYNLSNTRLLIEMKPSMENEIEKSISTITRKNNKFDPKNFIKYSFNDNMFALQKNIIDIDNIIIYSFNYSTIKKFLQFINPNDIPPETYIKAIYKNSKFHYFDNIKLLVETSPLGAHQCEKAVIAIIKNIDKFQNGVRELKCLLKNGAKLTIDDVNVKHRFKMASRNGHFQMVKLLVKNGIDIHINKDYALRRSARKGHIEIVEFLVQNGADISAKNYYAIKLAFQNNHHEVLEYLVDHVKYVYRPQEKIILFLSMKLFGRRYNTNPNTKAKFDELFNVNYI
ncbi:ankyrin repeat protein [Cotonvirus japonicus]|uniref:Ankyrin repeat protein n=1 Tax=Cotonvirus japonicus TaxID=2811091 RepID=A0ABM7NRF4_9VIRU|nr:ankyrin repeat protein [Cotonvirus japonicus]BCS82741.1 ankyrin repeat protein [Cotonvirus japonicus]